MSRIILEKVAGLKKSTVDMSKCLDIFSNPTYCWIKIASHDGEPNLVPSAIIKCFPGNLDMEFIVQATKKQRDVTIGYTEALKQCVILAKNKMATIMPIRGTVKMETEKREFGPFTSAKWARDNAAQIVPHGLGHSPQVHHHDNAWWVSYIPENK